MMRLLSLAILLGLFLATLVSAGTNTLSSVAGGKVLTSHPNQYYTALNGNLVPRNTSGVATALAGTLGESTLKWLKAWIESGYWRAGDLKQHHSYNGTVTCGQGWMLADGDIINEANYDADTAAGHTAGDWDTYVVSSPLDGKYLPNMTGRYGVGATATTQAGTVAITPVGNTSHLATSSNHVHQWVEGTSDATGNSDYLAVVDNNNTGNTNYAQKSFNSSGSLTNVTINGTALTGDWYTAPSGTESINAQPDSIQLQYCLRVID